MSAEAATVDAPERSTGGPWIGPGRTAAATWALFCGVALVMMGNGLGGSLLGVRARAEGFGLEVTGVIMAAYFAGFLIGSRYAEMVLSKVGHIRVFAALASLASSAMVVHAVSVNPLTWAVMRFVFGFCMAGLYVVAESWLGDLATNRTRGRILAVYMVVTMGGLSVGQLMLGVADTDGFRLFVLASVLVSVSLVPVTLSASSAPPRTVPHPMPFRELVRIVPTGVVTAFWTGSAHGIVMGMGAVYATSVGMSRDRIGVFLAAAMIGAVVLQWPVGWLSDRISRRVVIAMVAVGAVAVSLAQLFVINGSWPAVGLMFLLGGMTFPLYSLAIAYTQDWVPPEKVVGASAALVRTTGSGAIVGPVVAAVLMASFDEPNLFFWTLAGAHALVAAYVGYRILTKEALPMERQGRFIAWPGRASAAAARLINGRRRTLSGDRR